MDEVQGNAVLDVYEQCCEVTAAWRQYKRRGKPCRKEYTESVKKLARMVGEAKAKGVPETITAKLMLEHVPTDALREI